MFNLKEIQPEEAKQPWSNAQLDAFMEMYLDGVRLIAIARRLGRSFDSVKVLPWKLATNYHEYTPGPGRVNRAGTPWDGPAREIWRLGTTSPDAARRGVTAAYLCRLLARAHDDTPPTGPFILGLLDQLKDEP